MMQKLLHSQINKLKIQFREEKLITFIDKTKQIEFTDSKR